MGFGREDAAYTGEKGGIYRTLLDVIGETMPWTSLQSDVMDIIGETTGGQWSWKLYKKD